MTISEYLRRRQKLFVTVDWTAAALALPIFWFAFVIIRSGFARDTFESAWWVQLPFLAATIAGVWLARRVRCPSCDGRIWRQRPDAEPPPSCPHCRADFGQPMPNAYVEN